MLMPLKESDIQRVILEYLDHHPEVFAVKITTTGIPNGRGGFRKNNSRGVSDIIGVYKGKFLAIEVKRPGGQLTEHQKYFLDSIKIYGGIGIVAYSLDDVIQALKQHE